MSEDDYIKSRLEEQRNWYSQSSRKAKKWYQCLKFVEIFSASLILLLAGFVSEFDCLKYMIGILGFIIAIVSGSQSIFKFQENWIKYRTTSESLKHEKYLYETKCFPYDEESSRYCRLVQRVEHLISQENSNWQEYIIKDNS